MHGSKRSRVVAACVGAAAVAVLMVPGTAVGQGPGSGGGGGGPKPPGEEGTKNLSVPALFVGAANPYNLTCDGTSKLPDGQTPSTGYSAYPSSYFFVQGINTWQASCLENQVNPTVVAKWGDNLTGSAKKSVGSPIRVEVGLTTAAPAGEWTGWDVLKLENTLDRLSAYGTLAEDLDGDGIYTSLPESPYEETRVWASGAKLKIYPSDAAGTQSGTTVYDGDATAEINSTGRVTYGYNLRVSTAGYYAIQYTFPGVTISSAEPGAVNGQTVTLVIQVTAGGGGRR